VIEYPLQITSEVEQTMLMDAVLASWHHLAMLALITSLAAEMVLLTGAMTADKVARLGRVDAIYGISAVMLLFAGGMRTAYGAKGWAFYEGNVLFWVKVGLFVVIGAISVLPTIRFIQWRRAGGMPAPEAIAQVKKLVMLQTTLLLALPVLAAFMARGIGF
jgi:putative membrane protein